MGRSRRNTNRYEDSPDAPDAEVDQGDTLHLPERPAMPERICNTCHEALPLSAHYFDRENADPLGFKRICKQCRSEQATAVTKEVIDTRLSQWDEKSVKLLDTVISSGGSAVPHHAELFEEWIRLFGGPSGFAGHCMAHYLSTPIGTKERTNVLNILVKMSEKVTDSGAAAIPMEMLTTEDLKRQNLERLQLLLKQAEQSAAVQAMQKQVEAEKATLTGGGPQGCEA